MSGGAMPLSLKRTVGALSLGGGGAGVALTLAEVGRQEIGTAEFWILAIFAILFGLGIGIGVAVLEGNPRASFAALLYYVAQIPLVFSSSISYQFAAGAYLYVAASPSGISLPMAIGARFALFRGGGAPFSLGLNIVALIASILLWRSLKRENADAKIGR